MALFGWSNPEATVTSTNLDRSSEFVGLDADSLSLLGPDAASVLEANGLPSGVACIGDDVQPFWPFGWNRSWAEAC